ncbi:MAG: 50S ribosomal protein L6 [Candidatus Wildermuthbacteria bacterium RIFCSPHIGHO2_12_FULL_45_9]|uniref:Large ribosomal subunit protein uL6 n=1 Tax=Candidatus Wildermuthbacteria bacterium RIFCSPHIGHO2_02_FULL_45_25 TaxID=1802450 RepID=A0A1G2R4X4_9BACT|nr:MAG: 50S ribosomal protein L6 [Candidatus Wildermuthbacteria bacterium RIFCSPHIGHO2_01_FULL_45_20]OHA67905.1 MAG: 50S ribosomal protein L6 [Candidatus Wildermuthbacteria bacterium RIFCSPHIGHO2_02_FULL_45_25]OHA70569.1 MAG: 50S ribosomal protein L6 [Candidatus Wildermuthbacteria bacterium RIFCSPHIGHO2_12_FULL_45_9]
MSRIGKKPIEIPTGVQVQIEGQTVQLKGPKGELCRVFPHEMGIIHEENVLTVTPHTNSKKGKELWGLTRTLLANMIIGVTQGYVKKLELEGVGYRASTEGKVLNMTVGFSHPIVMQAPEFIAFSVEKNIITVSGIDKEKVGEIAARIRAIRPVEPYKGKGIRYEGEVVRRKLGKRAAGAGK